MFDALARASGLEAGIGSFNLGESSYDCRSPDGGLFRQLSSGVWHPTAALVLEIVSPDDDSWSKFGLFAAHAVDEVLIVDPQKRSVDWFALDRSSPSGPTPGYSPIGRSGLIELGAAELAQRLDWPALEQ